MEQEADTREMWPLLERGHTPRNVGHHYKQKGRNLSLPRRLRMGCRPVDP